MFSRRGFIRIGSATVGSMALRPFGLLPALAQSGPDYRALVCVFLYGGNDSNNMVLPVDDASFKAYTSIRGPLALSKSQLTTATTVSGQPLSFHASLPEINSLFNSKELAVVANVGNLVQPLTRSQYQAQQAPIPMNLFSHSDQQIAWQTSVAQGNSATGWAGRAADYIATQGYNSGSLPAFLSVDGAPLLGAGANNRPITLEPGQSMALQGFANTPGAQSRLSAMENLLNLNSGISLVQAANQTMSNSIADANALGGALASAKPLKTKFPSSSLGVQLQQVAQIIQVQSTLGMRRQIFFCSLTGFDTHVDEMATLQTLYPELSPALAAFYSATQELGMADNVTTFTESDFSRTLQPTSGDGSDHAWGGHHLVLGGAVSGGKVYGQFPTFQLGGPNDADTRGRWIPTTSIDQYGATFCSWFGVPDAVLPTVFPNLPNFSTKKLAFLG